MSIFIYFWDIRGVYIKSCIVRVVMKNLCLMIVCVFTSCMAFAVVENFEKIPPPPAEYNGVEEVDARLQVLQDKVAIFQRNARTFERKANRILTADHSRYKQYLEIRDRYNILAEKVEKEIQELEEHKKDF